jgi:hypothetical protein
MNVLVRQNFNDLRSEFKQERYEAFMYLINKAKQPVDWVYEVWADVVQLTRTGDNHQRTLAVQLIAELAKSDIQNRLADDYYDIIAVTHDNCFTTARHSLKVLWKIGIANLHLRGLLIRELSNRFLSCKSEKNCQLIRYDIIEVFWKMYSTLHDDAIEDTVELLIESEQEPKCKQKYLKLWSNVFRRR